MVGAPKTVTNKLQRVLNTAARVVSGSQKFDHDLMQLIHPELPWLRVPERVKYKLRTVFTYVSVTKQHNLVLAKGQCCCLAKIRK